MTKCSAYIDMHIEESATALKMRAIEAKAGWQEWYIHWVFWSDSEGQYVGYAPDNVMIAFHPDADEFLSLFENAAKEVAMSINQKLEP